MLGTFEGIRKNFRLKPPSVCIDNFVFQLHYRLTTLIFLVASILVTSRQYIGEHIKCISDAGVNEAVMNSFCFVTSTFTIVKQYDDKMVALGVVAHPGVGPYGIGSTEEIRRHSYYQWVPFLLFGHALMFYATHLLWKHFEKGRIKNFVGGLELAAFAYLDKELEVRVKKGARGEKEVKKTIPSKEDKQEYIKKIRSAFLERFFLNRSWSIWLVVCEVLNALNVIFQGYVINKFLGGKFYSLGIEALNEMDEVVTPLDEIFPKVTKCTFHKYGPSGTIQNHDAMCIMALNVINEKIYIFLWFWLILLFIISCLGLVYRAVTVFLHARSETFNRMIFAMSYPARINPWNILTVTNHCNFTDWIFLKYVAKNVDALVFRELVLGLAEELEAFKIYDEEKDLFKAA